MDDAEVAKDIAKQLEGLNIKVPFNVMTPSLRDELVKLGVKIGPQCLLKCLIKYSSNVLNL